ncbi:MAG: hypothetical protein II457_05785 [Paludibacteraceae bacterium]|nr:hypothetical protein [Paludibacteraceae bacterium]
MKKFFSIIILFVMPMMLKAGVTTYTFTSLKWASKVGATVCDGTTDGWISNKDASEYSAGRLDSEQRLYSCGVGVKTGTTGAGATSVQTFTDVRRVTVNFCQNSSKGQGTIYIQVGDNTPQAIKINKPAKSGEGVFNRDSIVTFEPSQSGKIKFWVDCTENGIYINTIAIRSASGGSSVFTIDTYQLVTNVEQLVDSDQVIFGVYKEGVNDIMGYFDETESVNNIHAIKGRYSSDRSQVDADDRAIYTLRIADLNGQKAYVFQDELRYEEAYLVASGGQTKNRLALWTDVVDEKTYGNYGFWDITIENGAEAVITNLGNSKAKIIQYNASNNPTLFACYADRSQTPVCLYRRVEAIGDVPAIVAPMVNFGTTIETQGARTITVNANKLTADIAVSLKQGDVFAVSASTLDRDGEDLTISYTKTEPGRYVDTLVLTSGDLRTEVAILLHIEKIKSVAEAVHSEDYATIYLNDVIVTKKYDNYIYVRDETGSMLLFDRGDGATGKRYGADVKAGDPLSGVTGRFINYFGVPEISPSEQFNIGKNQEVLPEQAGASIDSADVCRYMQLDSVIVTGWTTLTYKGKEYAYENKFNLPNLDKNSYTRITAIISYDHDVVTLYIVSQEQYTQEGLNATQAKRQPARLVMRDGVVFVETDAGTYTLQGEKIF